MIYVLVNLIKKIKLKLLLSMAKKTKQIRKWLVELEKIKIIYKLEWRLSGEKDIPPNLDLHYEED